MKLKDEAGWKEGLAKSQDPYAARCYSYAEAWADLMEKRLTLGQTVEQCAEETSREADTDRIIRFIPDIAISLLAQCWEHGEELRRWHNLKTQIC